MKIIGVLANGVQLMVNYYFEAHVGMVHRWSW